MKWFRSYHGAPMDPKWPVVAKRANCRVADVAAIWWALEDYASQQDDRGSIEGFDPEQVAVFFQIEQTAVQAVMQALTDKACLTGKRIANWEEYQPDETSTPRVKRFRNGEKRSETVPPDNETEGNENPSMSLSGSQSVSSERDVVTDLKAEFEVWYGKYPRKQARAAAEKAFAKARRKTDLTTLVSAVVAYVANKPGYADWCMPATWLNEERWLDEHGKSGVVVPVPTTPKFGPKPFVPAETNWSLRLAGFRKNGYWATSWGPKPGESGCGCPPELLKATA